eukprot:1098502-Alexandrium_andersonii.AAC.1
MHAPTHAPTYPHARIDLTRGIEAGSCRVLCTHTSSRRADGGRVSCPSRRPGRGAAVASERPPRPGGDDPHEDRPEQDEQAEGAASGRRGAAVG